MASAEEGVHNIGKVGLFDSGLGGLTVLRAVARQLPEYDYLFYGDTANLPLGDKTEEEIYQLTKSGVEELFRRDAILVIIACNTASAETLRRLQDGFLSEHYPDRRILGVIIPTIEELIDTGSRSALLIATRRTVESGKYDLELQQRSSNGVKLESLATPSLVPLIESGAGTEALQEAITAIEAAQLKSDFDTVVLGCTHYVKLKDGLRAHFATSGGGSEASAANYQLQTANHKLNFLSQDEIIPLKLKDYLARHPEIVDRLGQGKTRSVHLTLHRPDYDQVTEELLSGAVVTT